MPRIGLDSPLLSSKRAIGVGENGKACSSVPAFNYVQSTAPAALIGETWRKVIGDRIIAEAFWDGDRWLSNQLKSAIIASSGTANFPAFVNPASDLWVEDYIFSGYGTANHTNADYYTFSLNQNAIYYSIGYFVVGVPLASFDTKTLDDGTNLINAGSKFEIKIPINKFVNCTSNTGMNNAISAVSSFSITRINTGNPVTPFVPKQMLFYREVIT